MTQQQQHSEDSWDIEDGTVDDVREAVVANLEHRGVMRKLRAKVKKGSKRGKPGFYAPHPYIFKSIYVEDRRKTSCITDLCFLYVAFPCFSSSFWECFLRVIDVEARAVHCRAAKLFILTVRPLLL